MHKFASLNHQIIFPEQAFLPAISSASLYGKGVFTTIAIYDAKPFLWEKHWLRLKTNAQKIGIDLAEFNEEAVKKNLSELISHNEITNARARVTFFDASSSGVWTFPTNRTTSLLITTAEFREIKNQLTLTVSPFRINSASPLAGVKSCNYLENLLALEEAARNGFDEAIRLNERGEIASASMANVFWSKSGNLFTPSLPTGCLAGTTREFILENFAVCEKEAKLDELAEADEVFLTSSGIGIAKVESVDEYKFSDSFEKTEELQSFFKNFIK